MFPNVFDYKPSESDYRIWLVVNPSKWLIPIFISLVVLALAVHSVAFSLPGYVWESGLAAEAPAAEAPAAAPAE